MASIRSVALTVLSCLLAVSIYVLALALAGCGPCTTPTPPTRHDAARPAADASSPADAAPTCPCPDGTTWILSQTEGLVCRGPGPGDARQVCAADGAPACAGCASCLPARLSPSTVITTCAEVPVILRQKPER